jgi:hypothetical protein
MRRHGINGARISDTPRGEESGGVAIVGEAARSRYSDSDCARDDTIIIGASRGVDV